MSKGFKFCLGFLFVPVIVSLEWLICTKLSVEVFLVLLAIISCSMMGYAATLIQGNKNW